MNELSTQSNSGSALSEANFQHTLNLADRLSKSTLLPDHFKGKPENVILALSLARDLGISQVMALNQISVIGGKPCIQSALMVALLNQRKVLKGPLRFKYSGDEGQPNRTCVAYGTDAETGEVIEGPPISLAMAQAEGWTRNAKYRTLPDTMLRWRAVAFFTRAYYPETVLGMHTTEEMEDVKASGQVRDVTPEESIKDRLKQYIPQKPEEPQTVTPEVLPPESTQGGSVLIDLLATINEASDSAEMTNLVPQCAALEVESEREAARRAMANRAEQLGLKFNGRQKCYVEEVS